MQVEFKREDYKKSLNKIVILVGWPTYQAMRHIGQVDVKSPSGVVKSFNYNKVKTELYWLENEGWDGEYQCMLFDQLIGREHTNIIVEIGVSRNE